MIKEKKKLYVLCFLVGREGGGGTDGAMADSIIPRVEDLRRLPLDGGEKPWPPSQAATGSATEEGDGNGAHLAVGIADEGKHRLPAHDLRDARRAAASEEAPPLGLQHPPVELCVRRHHRRLPQQARPEYLPIPAFMSSRTHNTVHVQYTTRI